MKSSDPNLALVGAGYWGKNLARNFRAAGSLHTLCDAMPRTLEAYGAEYDGVRKTGDYGQVLADRTITRVAIAAPAALHHQIARDALQAGKDVFVEKPLCLHVHEAEELVALAAERGRVLMVGHLLQYHPCVRKLQAMVASGELGKLYYLTSNRLNLGKIRQEENALWSFAPHDLSVILSLVSNQLPEEVRCQGEAYLNLEVADTTLTTLRFAGSVRSHVFVSWLNPFKEQKLTVIGSEGMVVFDDTKPWSEKLTLFHRYLTWSGGQVPVPSKGTGETVVVPEAEPLGEECRHFLECCESRARPRTDGEEGLRVLRVLHAAQASLERGGERTLLGRGAGPAIPSAAREGAVATSGKSSTGAAPAFFAHVTAVIDEGAEIGTGSSVWHFSHVSKGAKLGEHCNLGQNVFVAPGVTLGRNVKVQNNVSIYSGTEIEDDVFLGPSCVLTNVTNPRSQVKRQRLYEKTTIRRGATVGANATIVCGVTLGRYCFIAAGAVVTRDIPDYALVMGQPAKPAGWMSRHGHVLREGDASGVLRCPESGLRYVVAEGGGLRCLDLDEEAPLPPELSQGLKGYREFKAGAK